MQTKTTVRPEPAAFAPLQGDAGTVSTPALANAGLTGASASLPHAAAIQDAFAAHHMRRVSTSVGGDRRPASAQSDHFEHHSATRTERPTRW